MPKGITVYEVLYHDDSRPYGGAAGDGSFIARFRKKDAAERFAKGRRCYSGEATVDTLNDVPRRLVDRWSFQG